MTWKDKIEDNSVVETFLNQILEWQDVKEHYYPIFPSIIFLLLFFQGIKACNPSDVASAIFSAVLSNTISKTKYSGFLSFHFFFNK
jgi:hypothetical protein